MEAGQIPYTKIIEYAKYYGFNRHRTQKFITYIQVLDSAFLNWMRDKSTDKATNGNTPKLREPSKKIRQVRK